MNESGDDAGIPEDQMVLSCEIPKDAIPGSRFHVQLDDRFFEVVTPEGALPGQTINIVVPRQTQAQANSQGGADTQDSSAGGGAVSSDDVSADEAGPARPGSGRWFSSKIKEFDSNYRISETIVKTATPAVEKLRTFEQDNKLSQKMEAGLAKTQETINWTDEKLQISKRTSSLCAMVSTKAAEFEQKTNFMGRLNKTGDAMFAYAREIDSKYAISATAASYVAKSREALQGLWYRSFAKMDPNAQEPVDQVDEEDEGKKGEGEERDSDAAPPTEGGTPDTPDQPPAIPANANANANTETPPAPPADQSPVPAPGEVERNENASWQQI
jgi:hypothetical protein